MEYLQKIWQEHNSLFLPSANALRLKLAVHRLGGEFDRERYDLWQNILPQPQNAPVTGEIDPKEYRYWQIQTAVDDYLEARRGTRPSNQTGEEPENLSPSGRQDLRPAPRRSARTRQTGAKRSASQDNGPTRKSPEWHLKTLASKNSRKSHWSGPTIEGLIHPPEQLQTQASERTSKLT